MSFNQQSRRATARMERAMKAAAQLSIERVVAKAEIPQGDGGRFRIDTGFMRATGGAAFGTFAIGPTTNPERRQYGKDETVSGMPLPEALARWDFQQKITYGWTARYARPREAKDGFMLAAAQLWPRIVSQAVSEVRRSLR